MTIYYTEDHEWLRVDGGEAFVGITRHAAEQLGDIVFVELRAQGESFAKADEMGVIESVKAASSIYSPVSCQTLEANQAVVDAVSTLNADPEGAGWLYRIRLSNLGELDGLMDAAAYAAMIG